MVVTCFVTWLSRGCHVVVTCFVTWLSRVSSRGCNVFRHAFCHMFDFYHIFVLRGCHVLFDVCFFTRFVTHLSRVFNHECCDKFSHVVFTFW